MTCLADEEVIALLAGRLDAGAFTHAEQHLDGCRLCRLLVSTLAARTGDGPPRRVVSAFGPGELIADRYRVVALLGVGGMGEVYEAVDVVLHETIALKTISAGATLGDRGVAGLKAEVQFARSVTHRNVCRVFDVGFHTDVGIGNHADAGPVGRHASEAVTLPFFTMELLAGETLRSHLRRTGPMPLSMIQTVLDQMASGLDAAHAAGVIHRDLKSENVMLVPDAHGTRVVITDFGLAGPLPGWARGRPSGAATPPTNRAIAGTFGYMAPEQLARAPTGPATDIYALGVVAFEMATGNIPFGPSEIAMMGMMGTDAPRGPTRPLSWPSGVPAAWRAAIARCLEISPAARFQNAGELVAALGANTTTRKSRRRLGRVIGAAMAIGAAITSGFLVREHVTRGDRERSPAPANEARLTPPQLARPRSASAPITTEAMPLPARAWVPRWTGDRRDPPSIRRIPSTPALRVSAPRRDGRTAPMTVPESLAKSPTASPSASESPGVDDLVDPFGQP